MADDLGGDWWKEGDDIDEEQDDEADSNAEDAIADDKTVAPDNLINDDAKDGKFSKADSQKCPAKRKSTTVADEPQQKTTKGPEKEESNKRKRPKKKRISEATLNAKGADAHELRRTLEAFYKGTLSVVEREELSLSDEMIRPTNVDLSHTASSFLKEALPKWQRICSAHVQKMSPLILVLSFNANRALQINRDATSFKGEKCKSAKLFARHMKPEEQAKFLKSTVVHFAFGTPTRVATLLAQGSLNLSYTRLVMLDWNWRDVKMKRMVDIADIRKSLMNLLKDHVIPACKKDHVKIGLF